MVHVGTSDTVLLVRLVGLLVLPRLYNMHGVLCATLSC